MWMSNRYVCLGSLDYDSCDRILVLERAFNSTRTSSSTTFENFRTLVFHKGALG